MLEDEDKFIRCKTFGCIKYTLDEAKLRLLADDQTVEIRAGSYLELLARNVQVDISEIQKKLRDTPDTESLADILVNLNTKDIRGAVLLEVYKRKSFEELKKSIYWFSLPITPLIYEALAENYFDLFKETLRQDVLENFERIKKEGIDLLNLKIAPKNEETDKIINKIITDFEELDSWIRTEFLRSAIKALAKKSEPSDIEIVRFFIDKPLGYFGYFRDEILRDILTIFDKYGTTDDAKLLIKLVADSQHDIKIEAAGLALRLDKENKFKTLEFLLERNETELTKVVIKYGQKNPKVIKTEQIKELLLHSNDQMRLNALSYLMSKLSDDELKVILDEYLQSETYYYNVVCWLDRRLYAPNGLREWYRKQMTDRLL